MTYSVFGGTLNLTPTPTPSLCTESMLAYNIPISSYDYYLYSFSQELSEIGIFYLNALSKLELLKPLNKP